MNQSTRLFILDSIGHEEEEEEEVVVERHRENSDTRPRPCRQAQCAQHSTAPPDITCTGQPVAVPPSPPRLGPWRREIHQNFVAGWPQPLPFFSMRRTTTYSFPCCLHACPWLAGVTVCPRENILHNPSYTTLSGGVDSLMLLVEKVGTYHIESLGWGGEGAVTRAQHTARASARRVQCRDVEGPWLACWDSCRCFDMP